MKHLFPSSFKNNPFRFRLRISQAEEIVLSKFFRLSDSFFSRIQGDDDDQPADFRVIRKDGSCTMEWELRQSAATLVLQDLKWAVWKITPVFLRRRIRYVRQSMVIFLSVDEFELEQSIATWPVNEQQHAILMQQKIKGFQGSGKKLVAMTSRAVIHFSDAVKYIMMRSLRRMKKLPGINTFIAPAKYFAAKFPGTRFLLSTPLLRLFKKLIFLIMNKRN